MTNTLTKSVATSYTQGIPGTPGTPGYYSYSPQTVCGFSSAGATFAYITPTGTNFTGQPQLVMTSPGTGPTVYQCQIVQVPTWHPAVQATSGTPSTTTTNYNLGWNSGARSLASFNGDGFVQFTPLEAVGIEAGLNNNDVGFGYVEILYGWYFAGGYARIYESGVNVFNYGAYTRGDVFRIVRQQGTVTYYRNGALVYTSATPSTGLLFLDSSLYSGGDAIDAPSIGNLTESFVSLPALAAYGSQGNVASAPTTLPALSVTSNWAQGGTTTMAALVSAAADRPYGSALTTLPALSTYADAGMNAPAFAVASATLPALVSAGTSPTGQITIPGGGATTAPSLQAWGADRPYGTSTAALPALRLFSVSNEGMTNASMGEGFNVHDALTTVAQLIVVMNSALQVQAVVSYAAQLSASALSTLQASTTMSPKALLSAIMRSAILAASDTPVVLAPGATNDDVQVWVLDWDSGASTSYESYHFNSFAQLDGKYYGAKADGIYLLDGPDDAGTPIQASVNMGRQLFGTTSLKHIPTAYAGVSATGTLYLRVTVDGNTYTYAARNTDGVQRTQRFDMGKGMRGSYYTFELYNSGGDDFDLDTVEFVVLKTDRRI